MIVLYSIYLLLENISSIECVHNSSGVPNIKNKENIGLTQGYNYLKLWITNIYLCDVNNSSVKLGSPCVLSIN